MASLKIDRDPPPILSGKVAISECPVATTQPTSDTVSNMNAGPVTRGDDSIEAFANDLNRLRLEQGITHAALARQTYYSQSTISEALRRTDRLPSAALLQRIVGVLDPEHEDKWMGRRAHLLETSQLEAITTVLESQDTAYRVDVKRRRRSLPILTALSSVVSIVVGIVADLASSPLRPFVGDALKLVGFTVVALVLAIFATLPLSRALRKRSTPAALTPGLEELRTALYLERRIMSARFASGGGSEDGDV